MSFSQLSLAYKIYDINILSCHEVFFRLDYCELKNKHTHKNTKRNTRKVRTIFLLAIPSNLRP